jgi:hypothetical protein
MAPTVRAKFKCTSKTERESYDSKNEVAIDVTLSPVLGDENKPWSKYTPSGSLEMTITNPDAAGAFKPGQCYLLDFTPAEG